MVVLPNGYLKGQYLKQLEKHEEDIRKHGYPPFWDDWRMYMEDNGLSKKIPDNWWIRLDERTLQILRTLKELEGHQAEANGYIRENTARSVTNAAWLTALKWGMGLMIGTIIAAIVTKILGLWY